MLLKVHLSSL